MDHTVNAVGGTIERPTNVDAVGGRISLDDSLSSSPADFWFKLVVFIHSIGRALYQNQDGNGWGDFHTAFSELAWGDQRSYSEVFKRFVYRATYLHPAGPTPLFISLVLQSRVERQGISKLELPHSHNNFSRFGEI